LVARRVQAGTFRPEVETFGLASGVIRYEPNPGLESLVPASLKARVKAAADSIAAGTLVPAARPRSMQASGGSS
jgi:basic membrane lipoprotein Med (substrate-binding protein (PBP1-ABC) superfamily)